MAMLTWIWVQPKTSPPGHVGMRLFSPAKVQCGRVGVALVGRDQRGDAAGHPSGLSAACDGE